MMKTGFCMAAAVAVVLMMPTTVWAQTAEGQPAEDSVPQAQSHVVTSVESCIAQLSPAVAARVRQSLKPYEDCQNRLQDKLAEKEKEEAAEAANEQKPKAAETPRNYLRVQAEPAADKSEKSKP